MAQGSYTQAGPTLPIRKFAKQPLNLKFANADCDLTKMFANCKFDTPYHSSFQDIPHSSPGYPLVCQGTLDIS
jgi:hypothetical protein